MLLASRRLRSRAGKGNKELLDLEMLLLSAVLKPLIDLFEREGSFEGYTQTIARSATAHGFEVSASADALQFAL